ncbi:MAG: class I SAM-dependent methyltransferase [Campylobacterota bacterium]|nr:class I SAM-dependent methyltransferase [Campylobacterota bacterium]
MAYAQNKDFYSSSIAQHGNCAQGVHWNSQETQYLRFAALSGFIEDIQKCDIVDAGCGMGHYVNYLKQHDLMPQKYTGIDCEQQMILLAQEQHPSCTFKRINVLEDELLLSDYYVCSGALNILSVQQMYSFIQRCFEHSTKGFVFNFLSNTSYNNASVDDVIGFCQYLTPTLKTKSDYLHNDFTILMVK